VFLPYETIMKLYESYLVSKQSVIAERIASFKNTKQAHYNTERGSTGSLLSSAERVAGAW
jgi:hypothetical protein